MSDKKKTKDATVDDNQKSKETVVKKEESERGATANLSNAKLIISNLDDIVY
jgi:hypothetical protein